MSCSEGRLVRAKDMDPTQFGADVVLLVAEQASQASALSLRTDTAVCGSEI
jgi:hypothetical protein